MNFGKRLTELRKERGFTRTGFADYLGIPSTTLRNYETNQREPGHIFLKHIADIFKVSVDYLLGVTDDRTPSILRAEFNSAEIEHIKKYRALDKHGKDIIDTILAKEYTRMEKIRAQEEKSEKNMPEYVHKKVYYQPAAAGFGNYLDGAECETFEFPANEVPSAADFGIRISGDSMEPLIKDGSIVWVEAQPEIQTGQIGIFTIDADAYCKRLKVDHEARAVVLESENPRYDDIVIKDYMDIRTVGRVLL